MTNIPKLPSLIDNKFFKLKEIEERQVDLVEKANKENADKTMIKIVKEETFKDVDSMGNDPIWMETLNEHLKNDTFIQPISVEKMSDAEKDILKNADALNESGLFDKLMTDAYCPECHKLMGDGEYGCMCDYSKLGETYCKKCHKQLFNNEKCNCPDDGIDDKEWVDNAKAISASEVEENNKAIGRAWTQEEIDEELKKIGERYERENKFLKGIDATVNTILSMSDEEFWTAIREGKFKGQSLEDRDTGNPAWLPDYYPIWHDARKDLPKEDYEIWLACNMDGRCADERDPVVASYNKEQGWFIPWFDKDIKVTHWMKLPELPEGFK